MKHYGDVSKISGAEVEAVDIISFGSPCQDLSVAGQRAGIHKGERSNLFFEAVRIIKEMRDATNNEYPKYAVWENVPGAFSSNKGRDFHAVLEAFCSICDDTVSIPESYGTGRNANKLIWNKAGEIVGDNYSIAWRTLDAQYWGVPQRRKRIYLVADFTGRRAGEILFKSESLRGDMSQGNETGQEVTADAVGGTDGSVGVECFGIDHVITTGGNCTAQGSCVYERAQATLKAGGVHAVAYSFDSLSSNSMKSANPKSGCRAVEIAKCIDTTYPDPSKNQGGIAIVQPVIAMATQQGGAEIAENLCPTITAAAGMSGNNQPVIALQANGIDRADTAGCNGCGWRENESYTLNTIDRHAVCYPLNEQIILRHGALGRNTGFGAGEDGDPAYMLQANHPHAVCYDARGNGDGETACTITGDHQNRITDYTAVAVQEAKPPRRYIIRRLTPTECARLQGFPDWWGHLAPYNPADAEFWEDVRKTHAEINGKKYKPVKDLKKWYDKLHTDSAEYKMWGNGIALPNAEFVLHGIAEQGAKTLGSLFDGSGGFPLAGVMNGIKPLWASEVEPYPIAVTKSRFKEVHNG